MPRAAIPAALGPAALWLVARALLPTAVALGAALSAALAWQAVAPIAGAPRHYRLEGAVIATQLERAAALDPTTEVLVAGDSSGLINLDPAALAEALGGARVEGLATLGYSGPRGHAALLAALAQRDAAPRRVLLALSNVAPPSGPIANAVARLLRAPRALPDPRLLPRLRARLSGTLEPLLYLPLPGVWGDYYGSPQRFEQALREGHGFAHDPGLGLPPMSQFIPPYDVNDRFRAELPALREAVAALGAERVRLVLAPVADGSDAAAGAAGRAAVADLLHEQLGLDPGQALAGLPATLPAEHFASVAHLNATGRAAFTAALAEALRRDRARHPW